MQSFENEAHVAVANEGDLIERDRHGLSRSNLDAPGCHTLDNRIVVEPWRYSLNLVSETATQKLLADLVRG